MPNFAIVEEIITKYKTYDNQHRRAEEKAQVAEGGYV